MPKYRIRVSTEIWGDEREPRYSCAYSLQGTAETMVTLLPSLLRGLTQGYQITIDLVKED